MLALCPNCHRRAHYSPVGDELNAFLLEKARWLEDSLARGTLKYVTAGLVFNAAGRLLITRRPPYKELGDLWEFPGGKLQEGETLETCLQRELLEELGLPVDIERPFLLVDHDYRDFQVRLFTFICRARSERLQLREHSQYAWVEPEKLTAYQLAPADQQVLARLLEGRRAVGVPERVTGGLLPR